MEEAPRPPRHTLVLVPHTHWDREWYEPFQTFRSWLVEMLDGLIDLLDREPEFRSFVLDGQTVLLDDYLEVRPQRRSDIERLVRAGRLLIGPNYVLPDEFLIGGESWVRNLMLGLRAARSFGPPMLVGYSPDAFGHITHLPAILRGFGIDTVVIWRGVGEEATTSEFRWASPDGSEVLALYLRYGYSLAASLPLEPQALAARLEEIRRALAPLATTRYILLPNGDDHCRPQEGLPQAARAASALLDDAEVVLGDYPWLLEAVRRELGERLLSLPLIQGEFRSASRSHVLPGVLSARMWIKQRYQECEDLLARWAEPLATWASLLQANDHDQAVPSASRLPHGWRLLLQNAPHDSICGCSIDEVHREMAGRFDACQAIGEAVLEEAASALARAASPPGSEGRVVVFNSEDGPRTDFCQLSLPRRGARLPSALLTEEGEALPLQRLAAPRGAGQVRLGFVAPGVPGHGLRAFRLLYGRRRRPSPRPHGTSIENQFFQVSADPRDGTLTVHDKRLGMTLQGLNRFVDGGDRGDEYNYCPPAVDELVTAPAQPPRIRVLESGPARHTLEVALVYSLPRSLGTSGGRRSRARVRMPIVTRVYLYEGVPRIDIETEVTNRALDHRLRVHFPSGLRADRSYAEQHFGVVERPVDTPAPSTDAWELPLGTFPQKSFCAVEDGQRGLMLANRGLPEYEALREPDGTLTLALTLLRCVGWLSRLDLSPWRRGAAGPALVTPEAQMLGRWRFHYSLVPYTGTWEEAMPQAHRFARPLRVALGRGGSGRLTSPAVLVEAEPSQLVVSAVKLAEEGDGLVVRAYNAASRPLRGRVRMPLHRGPVEEVDLNEALLREVSADDGWIPLDLRPNEVRTLKFVLR